MEVTSVQSFNAHDPWAGRGLGLLGIPLLIVSLLWTIPFVPLFWLDDKLSGR